MDIGQRLNCGHEYIGQKGPLVVNDHHTKLSNNKDSDGIIFKQFSTVYTQTSSVVDVDFIKDSVDVTMNAVFKLDECNVVLHDIMSYKYNNITEFDESLVSGSCKTCAELET